MSSHTGRPPDLSKLSIVKLIRHLYSYRSIDLTSPKQLVSYDDRNYYFVAHLEDGDTSEFVFKIYNCLNNLPEVVCGVSALMSHLHSRGFLGTSQVTNRDGGTIAMVTGQELRRVVGSDCDVMDGHTYCIRVVRFVPGETMDAISKECITPKLLFEVGQFLGRIDTSLSDGFSNEAISTRVLTNFDQMHFQDMFPEFISSVEDPYRKKMAEQVFVEFTTYVAPRIPTFKRGILYNDAHTTNIIVQASKEQYTFAAFIDFDDAVNSCYLFELAVLVADVIAEFADPHTNPIELVTPLISGYSQEFELSKEEMGFLYYAVMTRCCQVAMVSEVQYKNEPWNDYLVSSIEPRWKVIELLLSTPKAEVDIIWSSAMGKSLNHYIPLS